MFETLYLSMDANFKLKQKERGFTDPPLANGFAYMVSNGKLRQHLTSCKGSKVLQDEVSSYGLMQCLNSDPHGRPSRVVQTSMLSTTHIQSTQQATLSQGLWVWIVLATDSNVPPGWWTYKRGNGMLFHHS